MKREKKVGRHTIIFESRLVGNDVLVTIYGGDEHHIGGVSIAFLTKSHYRDADTVSVNTLTFPGHKDYIVSNSAAERLAKALRKSIVVTVGIHMDSASKAEIEEAVEAVKTMVDETITFYQNAV